MSDKLSMSRVNGGNSAYKRIASDFYPTPPEATQALLDWLALPKGASVWEPACGEGHMVKVLQGNGYSVRATDIRFGADFLTVDFPVDTIDWIITNPPFSLADKFIERCAWYERPFALLLKSQYWHAKKRLCLFQECQPTAILPLTWRPDFLFKTRGGGSPLMDVMWCVWGSSREQAHTTLYHPLLKPESKLPDYKMAGAKGNEGEHP